MKSVLASYSSIMKNLSTENKNIRLTRKPTLDYFYTVIIQILEIARNKNIVISKKVCSELLETIVKK